MSLMTTPFTKLGAANSYIRGLHERLEKLENFQTAIVKDPDFNELYWGDHHGEPCAADLIESVVSHIEGELCHAVNVDNFIGYESDGGLEEAIAYNISSILRAAKIMNEDNEISHHDHVDAWKQRAEKLWKIMDDISTSFDACHPDYTPFLQGVQKRLSKRGDILQSLDGYTLVVTETNEQLGNGEQERVAKLEKIAEWAFKLCAHANCNSTRPVEDLILDSLTVAVEAYYPE